MKSKPLCGHEFMVNDELPNVTCRRRVGHKGEHRGTLAWMDKDSDVINGK